MRVRATSSENKREGRTRRKVNLITVVAKFTPTFTFLYKGFKRRHNIMSYIARMKRVIPVHFCRSTLASYHDASLALARSDSIELGNQAKGFAGVQAMNPVHLHYDDQYFSVVQFQTRFSQ